MASRRMVCVPAGFVPTLVSTQDVTNATRVVTFDVTVPNADGQP